MITRFNFAVSLILLIFSSFELRLAFGMDSTKVAVLAAKGNAKSEALAKYYVQKRAIPEKNILYIEFESEDEIERGVWNHNVKPSIYKWLTEGERKNQIECVVVLRGVSLNIVGKDDPQATALFETFMLDEEKYLVERIINAEHRLKDIAGDSTPADALDTVKNLSLPELGKRLNAVMEAANTKVAGMSPGSPQAQSFAPILLEIGGIDLVGTMLANTLKKQEGQNNLQVQLNHASLLGAAESLVYMINASGQALPTPEIVKLRAAAVERKSGLLGALEYYRKQRAEALAERTTSFDSELTAVLWPDTPQFLSTAPNFRALQKGRVSSLKNIYTTLMVGRIDGPTWQVCKRMVDDALSSESHPADAAKYYFDLRGLDPKAAAPGEAALEQSLTVVANEYQSAFANKSTVNRELGLFEENSCPDVFLYCGWLEPGKYSKIGNWLPGSIGYHISPISASELHEAESESWCNRMLNEGAAAVFGATDFLPYELMLSPSIFDPKNLDGTKTIIELYFENLAYVRTTNVLLGDPLYRPKIK